MAVAQPEVVQYLRDNLKKFPIDQLRKQLASEGVSDIDFDEALKVALRSASPEPSGSGKGKSKAGLLLGAGVAVVAVIGGLVAMGSREEPADPVETPAATAAPPGAFVGHSGYVVRLPPGYTAIQSFRDPSKRVEIVHFAKAGTDPTNFLHEGLFGQLGIVRLEVQPSPLAGNLSGLEVLTRHVTSRLDARGDKYTVKSMPLSAPLLRGVQITVELPNPGVQGYVLGERSLYHFTAGQEDEVYRDLVNSLRDVHAEN